MSFLYALRYLQVVAVVPRLCTAAFVAAVGGAAVTLAMDPSAAQEALAPVLLLQMFAASSGFAAPARRGYYDLLLTSGTPRWQIALAHYLASVMPGIASWMCIDLLELAASHGAHRAAVVSGTCLAFMVVSTVAWVAAIPLSRSAAALGWLLCMTVQPLASVVSPLPLLGVSLGRSDLPAALTVVALTAATAVAAAVRIMRADAPLETSQ